MIDSFRRFLLSSEMPKNTKFAQNRAKISGNLRGH